MYLWVQTVQGKGEGQGSQALRKVLKPSIRPGTTCTCPAKEKRVGKLPTNKGKAKEVTWSLQGKKTSSGHREQRTLQSDIRTHCVFAICVMGRMTWFRFDTQPRFKAEPSVFLSHSLLSDAGQKGMVA